jgi:hypothetical protein
MKRIFALAVLMFSAVVFAHTQQITHGATVYIEPMDGYEMALTSAISEKQVPLIVVTDRNKAKYVIKDTPRKTHNLIHIPHTSTNLTVVDTKSSQIVFAYTADKGSDAQTAGAFAEQLKQAMEVKQ